MASDRTTVLVSRFEDLVALGLRTLVTADDHLDLVAEDVAQEDLDRRLDELEPRVAIINFGALQNASDVRRLVSRHPATRLVVLANRPSAADSSQMLSFGATACLAKSTQARDVIGAIHLASRGMHVLPVGASDAAEPAGEPFGVGPDLLTPREIDVFELLRAGRTNAQIALALHVSVETVRTHRRHIYRKLDVRTRGELVALTAGAQR